MKKCSKKQILLACIIGTIILSVALFSTISWLQGNQNNIKKQTQNAVNEGPEIPKTSTWWLVEAEISIDGDAEGVGAHNWTWVEEQVWFSEGVGNSTDPYVLENIEISVDTSNAGLTIQNSEVYFVLDNLTITNLGGDGLELTNVSNAYVSSSNFNNNGNSGMYLSNVNSSEFIFSYFLNNTVDGIYATDSNLNDFAVDCSGNGRYGMILASSDNNTLILSQFIDNVEIGLVILEVEDHGDSVDNLMIVNTFENNGINAVDNCTLPNSWDNGEFGNIWDDYAGVDANDDTIGDTPYDIDGTAGAQDNYPYCDDGDEPILVSNGDDGDRDLWQETSIFTIITFAVIFVGVFCAGFILSKLITISPKKTKAKRK